MKWLLSATAAFLLLFAAARAEAGIRITDAGGVSVASGAVIVKGRPATFVAVQDPPPAGGTNPPVTWTVQPPAGVLAIADQGGGRVRVTGLRDWFDESPRREPTARLVACDGVSCVSTLLTIVPDVAGTWPTRLDTWLGGETRDLVFVQNGRFIVFDPEPATRSDPTPRLATLRLDGGTLRLVRRGTILTRFEGSLTDRTHGTGEWSSSAGFSGTWRAAKRP